jgi:hypothetical protein
MVNVWRPWSPAIFFGTLSSSLWSNRSVLSSDNRKRHSGTVLAYAVRFRGGGRI